MPDQTPPRYGWNDTWRPTGRHRLRPTFFGFMVMQVEDWRFPAGDTAQPPEFRWRRSSSVPSRSPMPNRVADAVASREAYQAQDRERRYG